MLGFLCLGYTAVRNVSNHDVALRSTKTTSNCCYWGWFLCSQTSVRKRSVASTWTFDLWLISESRLNCRVLKHLWWDDDDEEQELTEVWRLQPGLSAASLLLPPPWCSRRSGLGPQNEDPEPPWSQSGHNNIQSLSSPFSHHSSERLVIISPGGQLWCSKVLKI